MDFWSSISSAYHSLLSARRRWRRKIHSFKLHAVVYVVCVCGGDYLVASDRLAGWENENKFSKMAGID